MAIQYATEALPDYPVQMPEQGSTFARGTLTITDAPAIGDQWVLFKLPADAELVTGIYIDTVMDLGDPGASPDPIDPALAWDLGTLEDTDRFGAAILHEAGIHHLVEGGAASPAGTLGVTDVATSVVATVTAEAVVFQAGTISAWISYRKRITTT